MVVQQCRGSSAQVDFESIGETIGLRTALDKKGIRIYLRFVQLYGGGVEGRFIEELDKFRKSYGYAGRIVPSSTFEALTHLKLAPTEVCPLFVFAVVKTQASCPPKMVQDNICRFVTNSDIGSFSGPKKQQMLKAEIVLRQCRSMFADRVAQHEKKIAKAIGRLETMIVRAILKKESPYKEMDEVAAAFVAEVNEACAPMPPVASPWAAKSDSKAASSKSTASNIIQYNSDGSAVGALQTALNNAGRT